MGSSDRNELRKSEGRRLPYVQSELKCHYFGNLWSDFLSGIAYYQLYLTNDGYGHNSDVISPIFRFGIFFQSPVLFGKLNGGRFEMIQSGISRFIFFKSPNSVVKK